MVKKIFGTISIIFISFAVVLFIRTGSYKSAKVSKGGIPQYQIYFKKSIGPYHKIIDTLKEVETEMKKLGGCDKTFGYFLSDPEIVDHEKLVSLTGCVYPTDEAPQILVPPKGIETDFIGGEQDCYIGEFTGSPSLTAVKVYPKLKEMAQKDRKPLMTAALEVYEVTGRDSVTTTVYLCTKN